MKAGWLLALTMLMLSGAPEQRADPAVVTKGRVQAAFLRAPLSFEVNRGQTSPDVKYLSRGAYYTLFLTPTEAVLVGRRGSQAWAEQARDDVRRRPAKFATVLRMRLVGANASPQVVGREELSGKVNYLLGHDPRGWRTHIPTYARVEYREVYPGVNLVYYGTQRQLEYDFVVAPHADPHVITLGFQGVDELEVDAQGDLVLPAVGGPIRLRKPLIYQERGGVRQEIAGGYVLRAGHQVAFHVGAYDADRPLIIDPVLVYSTYLGGSDEESMFGSRIAVDRDGNAYVAGDTFSADFPTKSPLQGNLGGAFDAFVTKLNADGSGLVYSTYLGPGGPGVGEFVYGIAVDVLGNAYLTGGDGSGAFVTKLNADGSAVVYFFRLPGGPETTSYAIAVDLCGAAYVTGATVSTGFAAGNPLQPTYGGAGDAFVAKLNADGSGLVYATYLGGTGPDGGWGIAVDQTGSAYVTGWTDSVDFPTKNPRQGNPGGAYDAFVAKLNADGSALVYATYLGGTGPDEGFGIAVDRAGNAYVAGATASTDFPTTNPLQPAPAGGAHDAFVAKLSADGSALVYATYLGGTGADLGTAISVDRADNAYVTGWTDSVDFPTKNPLQPAPTGGFTDAFVAKLNAGGSGLVYSTYLGGTGADEAFGIAGDRAGNAYVAGRTGSPDFPTRNPFQLALGGGHDAFVAKIEEGQLPGRPAPRLLVIPRRLFGVARAGETRPVRPRLAVMNLGREPLDGCVGQLSNPFSVASGGGLFSLDRWQTHRATVEFEAESCDPLPVCIPPEVEKYTATLVITSSDPRRPSANVRITAWGLPF